MVVKKNSYASLYGFFDFLTSVRETPQKADLMNANQYRLNAM
ncbi:MAG: hypothetical protein V6Z78_00500 [Holosporaceae bacterium]